MHSKVVIKDENATISMVEFSQSNVSLPYDPKTIESEYFMQQIYPELIRIKNTMLFEYNRFGLSSLISITPINIRYYTPQEDGKFIVKTFVFALAIEEHTFVASVEDRSAINKNIIIWI